MFLAFAAQADVVYIDLSSVAFAAANGQHSFTTTLMGETITLIAHRDGLFDNAKLAWTTDGIGVKSGIGDPHEIGFLEMETTALQPPMRVDYVDIGKLFRLERLKYSLSIDNGAYSDWQDGPWGHTAGETKLTIGIDNVTGIRFRPDTLTSDFTVSGIGGVTVPDGGVTLMLLGGALVGLETLRRKFRA
jgi:hypothetical protein